MATEERGTAPVNLTLRQLKVFKTIAKVGSYRKSAKMLNTSQPALTKTIQSLEYTLGVEVFRRNTRSVTLTSAGLELLGRIEGIFEQLDQTVDSVRDVSSGRGGSINLTYVDFAILGTLPDTLARYRRYNPRIKINVQFASTADQIALVKSGKADLGFVMDIDLKLPSSFCRKHVVQEGLVAVVPPKHRLAERETIELAELELESFIMGDTWSRYNELIRDLCIERNFMPQVTHKAFLRDEMLAFVMAGLGVLVYPKCICNAGLLGLKVVPITDVPPVVRTTAIWRADAKNPVLPSFLREVKPM
ncbi:LysR family transcriptional regulator [Primorskyibacter marinus]|uniref:LysR family transcriptional regulator n=1 Tax=Primorskyibacter marinus TaxID=1977320 RepID=UPI001E4CF00A|nr:LysR family transcriptional regulator [Primorskyibacter marinus]